MIERHIKPVIERYSRSFPSVLITGARQTGKTTVLTNSADTEEYLTFDDPSNRLAVANDPKFFMEIHPAPIILDEIQYVPSLFPYLKMAIDSNRTNGMYYMTGSQQFHLMQRVSESLAGRIGILSLLGISIREENNDPFSLPFLPDKNYFINRKPIRVHTDTMTAWQKIHRGFYPELVVGNIQPEDFYPSYTQTYLERDIRELAQVGDMLQFMNFISIAAARTGQLVNYADMASTAGIDPKTAKKWLSILVASGIVYLIHPYSGNIEKRLVKTPKLYFADTGLAAYLTKWSNPEVLSAGAASGAFFETFIVMEVMKSFTNAGIEPPLYFYRDSDGKEIDLLIDMNGAVYPIEIKATATPSTKDTRNLMAAGSIKGRQIMDGTIICNCQSPTPITDTVTAIPYWYI